MANLKLKKTDLKGEILVGSGWLSTSGWATRTNGDRRLETKATVNAAFAGLDVGVMPEDLMARLEELGQPPDLGDGYQRTNVLIEDEDGALTRVYRHESALTVCISETYLKILGDPPALIQLHPRVWSCAAGVIAETTAECPTWAMEIE